MKKDDICQASLKSAAEKYVKRRYYKNAWDAEIRTFIAGAKWVLKQVNVPVEK